MTAGTANNGKLIGYIFALGFVGIWSSFIIASRYGATVGMTPYDLTALRFLVAGLATLPFIWIWWPRQLKLWQIAVLAFCGPGTVYSLATYAGLAEAPAAYAGVFANGTIPIFTALSAFLLIGQRMRMSGYLAMAVILAGCAALAFAGSPAGDGNILLGAMFFITASAVLSIYSVLSQRWQLAPKQALVTVNLPNMFVILPIWYFLLPSSLSSTSVEVIIFQGLFQGLAPGFIAIVFFFNCNIASRLHCDCRICRLRSGGHSDVGDPNPR